MGITVQHQSSTLSQLREIKSGYKMPPIVDDEVIDAAAAEKTEDAADGKAAEAEAKEEAVEEKKSKRWCYFSLHDKKNSSNQRNENLTQISPQTFRRKSPRKKKFYLSSISITVR